MMRLAVCAAVLTLTHAHYHTKPYDTDELVKQLQVGHHMEVEGVPADFECAWRTAAMAHAQKLQPFLSSKQQKTLFDALELGAAGNDHQGHTHGPCKTSSPTFDELSWDPVVADVALGRRAGELALHVTSAEELVAAFAAAGAHDGPSLITLEPGKTYRLNETLVLGPEHSHTTMKPSTLDGAATISGSKVLEGLTWTPVSLNNVTKGVYKATVCCVDRIDALRVNGLRATRARFPNADPEFDQFPKGYVTAKTQYMPPKFTWGSNETVELKGAYPQVNSTPGEWTDKAYGKDYFAGAYRLGSGGGCSYLTPPHSYWCQPDGRVAGDTYYPGVRPTGVTGITQHLPHSPYADGGKDMVLTYWRPGHWFSIMYNMSGPIDSNGDVTFGTGGFQGAEGHSSGAEWFIENVMEELDAPNEFYYNKASKELYLFYNGTGTPPSSVEVPSLAELIVIQGTKQTTAPVAGAKPVSNVSFEGITFTGQRPTYMEPHGLPSGGDWGMTRLGALRLQGTEGVEVTGCTFERLDGQAVLLDGYNRDATFARNTFHLLGGSGVVLWGYEKNGDGTDGNQPRRTTVTENFCHEIGIYQKQSSCYFHAVSAQSTITHNLFFNGPRAMVNFNDAFGGGELSAPAFDIEQLSDSRWMDALDRQPYLSDIGGEDGLSTTAEPAYSRLHNNFIVANYAADGGCYDNDDGSSWYLEQNNFCVYGGMKSNFEGHNKRSSNNVHAYASVYGDSCLNGLNQITWHYAEGYYNNICLLAKQGDTYLNLNGYGGMPSKNGKDPCTHSPAEALHTYLGGNKVYAPGGDVSVNYCGHHDGKSWLSQGLDKGSSVHDSSTVTSEMVVQWGVAALAAPETPATPPGHAV